MSSTSRTPRLEALLRRDRAWVLLAVAGVTALCWAYLGVEARRMAGMDMAGGAPSVSMEMARIGPWSARHFALVLAMWVLMMVGMMLPSATPMLLLHAQVARKAAGEGQGLAPTGVFALGYLLAWAAFSLAATAAQLLLDRMALLSPALVAASPALGGGILLAAGLYQLSPWKDACLRHCRAPAEFLARHWRPGRAGALRMGVRHGLYCLGCCWALMALLFVGGVMNLLWIAAITLFVLFEKLAGPGRAAGRLCGAALALAGAAVLGGWLLA